MLGMVLSLILIVILVVLVLALVGYIINAYQCMRLLQELGEDKSWLPWVPLAGTLNLALARVTFSEKDRKILWMLYFGLLAGIMLSGIAAPFDAQWLSLLLACLVGLLRLALWIGALVSIESICQRTGIKVLAPILCFILVPVVGPAISVAIMRSRMKAQEVVM